MEFKNNDEELNFIESQLSTEPVVNVITKEQFEERVYKVFTILWEKLSKSFGPAGAGTFISVYPAHFNTKDGFTIMKNIAFDKKLDQVISDMVMNICSRLNYTVGDGTTTAVIATKSTYESYLNNKKFFENNKILPRDILKRFEKYKGDILEGLYKKATPIRSNNPKKLKKNIEKVVYISSNGNKELTNMISSLYEELLYPAISVTTSNDGMMHTSIIEGYKINVSLTDKLYINNDNQTLNISSGADVIIFDHKVMRDTYEKILKPLSDASKGRGRHLICIAPYYDETALNGVIRSDLNTEYRKTQDINLVLTVCSKISGYDKVALEDLAMLTNTIVISPAMEREFMDELNKGENIYKFFDLDNRKIPDINICVEEQNDELGSVLKVVKYSEDVIPFSYFDDNKGIRVGYATNMDIGLKNSTFSGFFYDENMYNTTMNIAKSELKEIQSKCEKLGTFSTELLNKQQRVYALGLKTGIIEVGADSDLSQGYLKDTVDDAVKAAASAYNNGVVLGCNVTLMSVIRDLINSDKYNNEIDKFLLKMLYDGFGAVYSTVLMNRFDNKDIELFRTFVNGVPFNHNEISNINPFRDYVNVSMDSDKFDELMDYINCDKRLNVKDSDIIDMLGNLNMDTVNTVYGFLIEYSVRYGKVFDISHAIFNKEVINSTETDKEILIATIDLLSLLITGNQLVLR